MASDNDSILDGEEFAAIREAIAGAQGQPGRRGAAAVGLEAVPVALISEDRAAERAIPDGQRIVDRWLHEVRHILGRLFGKDLEVSPGPAAILDETGIKNALANSWMVRIEVAGRRGVCLVTASGPILEAAAVQRVGGAVLGTTGRGRNLTLTVLALFGPLGLTLVRGLSEAWKEIQGCSIENSADDIALESARRLLERAKVTVVLEVRIKGAVEGVLRLVASPEVLVAPPRLLEAVPAEPGAIKRSLGNVPGLVRVELGKAKLSLSELKALQPGTVLTLDRFVGDALPLRVQGLLVASGRAIVSRGALAVEVSEIHQD